MKKTLLRMRSGFLLLFAFSALMWGQGSETFEKLPTDSQASYVNRTWMGENGQSWSATDARTDQTINGKAITLRNGALTFGVSAEQQSAGIGRISFKAKAPFGKPDVGVLELVIDGSVRGSVTTSGASTGAVVQYSIDNLNIPTFSTIVLRQVAVGSRIAIDDIEWTANATASVPVVTSATLSGTVGLPFSHQIQATGVPSSFAINSGALPPGLALNDATGEISGTPTAVGNFTAAVTATNSAGTSAPAEIRFSIAAAPPQAPVATAATDVTTDSFTANWAAVTGADKYLLRVFSGDRTEILTATFDDVDGTGGNDGSWSGNVAASPLSSYGDWGLEKVYKAAGALKLGTAGAQGVLTTPALADLDGNATLTFRAGAWDSGSEKTTLLLEITGGGSLNITSVEMAKGAFRDFSVGITGATSETRVSFKGQAAANSRFFIDDIRVVSSAETDVPGSPFTVNATNKTVQGLQSGTTYRYSVRAENTAGTSDASNEVEVTTLSATTTYNGTAWSGGAPDATKDAVIDADMTLTDILNAKSLTVNAGRTLTLAAGSTLSIVGRITSNGNVIAEDGATVLQTENLSNLGQFVVHKTSAPLYRNDFVLWGAPTTGMTLKEYSPNTLDNRFYTFDEPANAWAAIAASTQFVPGRAYQFRAPNNFSDTASQSHAGIYTGTLNNGTYTAAVTRGNQGYNLLGNPYPSTLDAETFLQSNPLLEGTLYFYMHSNKLVNGAYAGNNWAVYNASGAVPADNSSVLPTKNIAAGQGFMVTATASGNVAFNNGMRTSAAAPSHKNTANIDRVWLRLSDAEGSHSTMLLAFVEGATDKFESNYDARAMGTEGHAVFTRVEGKRLKIDGRSSFRSTAKVLLGLDAKKPGTYTLSLSDMQGVFAAGQKVYITDRATNRTAELNTPFSFEAAAGMEEERFEISFEKSVMSVAETGRGDLQVFAAEAVLHIKANAPVDSLSVTDMSARKVLNRSNQSSELRIPIGHLGKGVYFVKVVSNGKASIHKIVLK